MVLLLLIKQGLLVSGKQAHLLKPYSLQHLLTLTFIDRTVVEIRRKGK